MRRRSCTFVWNASFPGADLAAATPATSGATRSTGVVESVQQKFTLLQPGGRAAARDADARRCANTRRSTSSSTQLNLSSPDRTHAHVTREGETLARIAARYYRAPGRVARDRRRERHRRSAPARGRALLLDSSADSVSRHGHRRPSPTNRAPARLLRAAVRDPHRGRRAAARRPARRVAGHLQATTSRRSTASSSPSTTGTRRPRRFKYVGVETAADLEGITTTAPRYRLFEPCNKRGRGAHRLSRRPATLMLRAPSPRWSRTFPPAARRRWRCAALNALHQLRRKQYSTTWSDKSDSEIAKNIGHAERHRPRQEPEALSDADRGHRRGAGARRQPLPYVAQNNQYDIDFLLIRAKRLGYVVYIREGDPKATDPDARKTHLYFGPSDGRTPGPAQCRLYKLRWGASLIDFKPTLTTANQVKSVTVNGWDRTKKKAIIGQGVARRQGARRQQGPARAAERSAIRARRSSSTSRCTPRRKPRQVAHRHPEGPAQGDGQGERRRASACPTLRPAARSRSKGSARGSPARTSSPTPRTRSATAAT